MNIEQDLVTEQWDDILDQKQPGRKSLLMSVFMALIALAAFVALLGFREATNKWQIVNIALIFGAESALVYIISIVLPPSPIKIPMSYAAKFFGVAALFTMASYLFKE